jgi:hypothetical protein
MAAVKFRSPYHSEIEKSGCGFGHAVTLRTDLALSQNDHRAHIGATDVLQRTQGRRNDFGLSLDCPRQILYDDDINDRMEGSFWVHYTDFMSRLSWVLL